MMIYCARITAIHPTLVFDGDLKPCHTGAIHLSGPVPKLHDLHGNLVIEEGRP